MGKSKPYVIQIFSNWENSGKLFTANIIAEQLQQYGFKYQIINFSELLEKKMNTAGIQNTFIEDEGMLSKYFKSNSYSEFVDTSNPNVDFIISIIPPISNGLDNTILLKSANINFVVFDANVTWTDADKFILEKYNHLMNNNTYSILTNAFPDNLEEMYGEMPKKRSALRVILKKTIKRFT